MVATGIDSVADSVTGGGIEVVGALVVDGGVGAGVAGVTDSCCVQAVLASISTWRSSDIRPKQVVMYGDLDPDAGSASV